MNSKHKKLFGVLAILALLTAGMGSVSAAPGTVDNRTDTTHVTYVAANKTLTTNFNASSNDVFALSINNSTSSNLVMNITVNGTQYYKFSGTWDTYQSAHSVDNVSTTANYTHNFTEADLSKVPMAINQNVTLTINYWSSGNQTNATSLQVYVVNTDERSVRRATSGSSLVTISTKSPPFYHPFSPDYKAASIDDSGVKINGSNTSIVYTLSDSATKTPFSNVTKGLSTSGTLMLTKSTAGGSPVPVFYKATPSWFSSSSMGTYAVYSPSDNTLTYHPGSSYDSKSKMDITSTSDVYRIRDIHTVWDLADGIHGAGYSAVTQMVKSGV